MNSLLKQSQYEILRTLRNRQFLVFSIAMPVMFYFIFLKVNGANYELNGTTWKTYFLMSMAAFSIVGSSLFSLAGRIAHERSQGWLRLVNTTPMSPSSYILGKCLSQFMVALASVTVLFIIGGLSQGIHLSLLQWLGSGLWLTVAALPFVLLGLLVGVAFNLEVAAIVCNILSLVLAILGGLWFPTAIMPKVMQSIAQWTPTYRFAHGAWQTVAGTGIHWSDIAVLLGYCGLFAALTLWVLRRKEEQES